MIGMLKNTIKKLKYISWILDIIFLPIILIVFLVIRIFKFIGISHFPFTNFSIRKIGLLPIVNHYYEPLFLNTQLSQPLSSKRELIGLNLNIEGQLQILKSFDFSDELSQLDLPNPSEEISYYYKNGSFPAGDANYYYSLIRSIKPSKIIEIGSGFSTLVALKAMTKNESEGSHCSVSCIEPFEMSWLNNKPVHLIRKKVELLDISFFRQLEENDILFIDSSHIIRPQGDVTYEILDILPTLNKGVYIHFHDIFTPNDYPKNWIFNEYRLWNEQYLLEAFLSNNNDFKVIGALNYLANNHRIFLQEKLVVLPDMSDSSPGSFWIKKIN